MPASFTASSLPDLSGRTAIVTGANSGIGLATTRALAGAGAHVVLAVRNAAKARDAAAGIAGSTEASELDLADLASVRAFVARWGEKRIDLLINNACATSQTLARTADGFELQFGTGHLGHFALTNLLLPHIVGRIVTVSSQAERMGSLDADDVASTAGRYTQSTAYARAKLANLLFTSELQRRLSVAGSPVRAHAAHPGFIATGIYADARPMTRLLVRAPAQSAEQGAVPVLYAAVADVPPDSFVGPSRVMHMRGTPTLIRRSRTARDGRLAARLWSQSEQLTGVAWPTNAFGMEAA